MISAEVQGPALIPLGKDCLLSNEASQGSRFCDNNESQSLADFWEGARSDYGFRLLLPALEEEGDRSCSNNNPAQNQ